MSIVHALLLGLLGGIGIWDSRIGGMWMLDRPLVLGPIVGLILGDFKTGIIVGGSLELIMMGIVGIGSATPPDTVSGAILATAFAPVTSASVHGADGKSHSGSWKVCLRYPGRRALQQKVRTGCGFLSGLRKP